MANLERITGVALGVVGHLAGEEFNVSSAKAHPVNLDQNVIWARIRIGDLLNGPGPSSGQREGPHS